MRKAADRSAGGVPDGKFFSHVGNDKVVKVRGRER
jgi:hypothetical protein